MKFVKRLFRRKEQTESQPLSIDGIAPAPMTPEPDDAELAAQALLEMLLQGKNHRKRHDSDKQQPEPDRGTAQYYRRLQERIVAAHYSARLRTMRFVAFCEQELKKRDLPAYGPGSLALLETELYKRIDTIEREGGNLKTRWQHCFASVTVRLMQAPPPADTGNGGDQATDKN